MRKTWWLIESFGYCYHFMSSQSDPIKRRTLYIGYLQKFEQKNIICFKSLLKVRVQKNRKILLIQLTDVICALLTYNWADNI